LFFSPVVDREDVAVQLQVRILEAFFKQAGQKDEMYLPVLEHGGDVGGDDAALGCPGDGDVGRWNPVREESVDLGGDLFGIGLDPGPLRPRLADDDEAPAGQFLQDLLVFIVPVFFALGADPGLFHNEAMEIEEIAAGDVGGVWCLLQDAGRHGLCGCLRSGMVRAW